jgi:hypothetical protein
MADYQLAKVSSPAQLQAPSSSIQVAYDALPSFSPIVSTPLLPYLAFVLLASTFGLAFYFTTYVFCFSFDPCSLSPSLPKQSLPLRELAVASTASLLGGFGIVALFCSVGVYV